MAKTNNILKKSVSSHKNKNFLITTFYSKKQKRSFGFTLAEVLITLTVIGVVAAMTVPTLTRNVQMHAVETQLKVADSMISQVMKLSDGLGAEDMNIIANNTSNMRSWFNEYFKPYFRTQKLCYQTAGCWHKKGEVKTLNGGAPSFETKVGADESTLGWATMTFIAQNGTLFNLDGSGVANTVGLFGIDSTVPSLQFYFDVNGRAKPNRIGKDIYIMIYTPEKGLVPAGIDRTKEQIKQNCESGNGYWCLAYVKQNGWKISDKVWKRNK